MKTRTALSVLTLLSVFFVAGCESSTDLDQVSVQGRWDSVGALRDVSLTVENQAPDGSFTGTWRLANGQVRFLGDGMNSGGNVTFTLGGYPDGDAVFTGRFTNEFRLEGSLSGVTLSGPAVFRRSSF